MTKTFRPDVEALEEKVTELQEEIDNSANWLRNWETMKDREIQRALDAVEDTRKRMNKMREDHQARIEDANDRIAVLNRTIKHLGGDQ